MIVRHLRYCFNSSCLRFGLCSHKLPAPAMAWFLIITGKAAKAESKWVDLDYSHSDPTPITSNTKFWSPKQFWTAIIFADLKIIGKWKLDSLRFLHSRLKSSSRHSRLIAKHSQEQELIVVPKMLDDSTMMCPLTSAGGSRQYSNQLPPG